MTMGTRNCPRCGTALNASWRGACGTCGAPFQEAPVAPAPPRWGNPAQPAQPQAWQGNRPAGPAQPPVQPQMPMPPAAPPTQPQQASPWNAPFPSGAPQQQPWAGAQPAPKARSGVNPLIFVLAGLLIVAVLVVIGVAVSAGSGGGSPAGSVSFSPASISCSSNEAVTMTIKLDGSVGGSERVVTTLDGKTWGSVIVSDEFTKQADGTWLRTNSTILDSCQGPDGQLAAGNHKLQVLDSHNKVLAEGSFTTSD
jgi:hypothetical protein